LESHCWRNNIIMRIVLVVRWIKPRNWKRMLHLEMLSIYGLLCYVAVSKNIFQLKIWLHKVLYDWNSSYIVPNLWSTDTPQIRRVPVSDTCRVWHRHDTDTYSYIEFCDFLKLLAVSACPVSVCISVFHSSYH